MQNKVLTEEQKTILNELIEHLKSLPFQNNFSVAMVEKWVREYE